MFKKGDMVIFYQDTLTNQRHSTTPSMNRYLKEKTVLEIVDFPRNNKAVGERTVRCTLPGSYDLPLRYVEVDLRLACELNKDEQFLNSLLDIN